MRKTLLSLFTAIIVIGSGLSASFCSDDPLSSIVEKRERIKQVDMQRERTDIAAEKMAAPDIGRKMKRTETNDYYLGEIISDLPEDMGSDMLGNRICPGDILDISVYGSPELHNPPVTVRVSSIGEISFPSLGKFEIAGLTETEATAKLNKMLLDGYLADPQVSLFIRARTKNETHSKFSITGAVRTPGRFEVQGEVSLVDAVNMAGGLLPDGDSSEIIVVRQQTPGEVKSYKLDLHKNGISFHILLRDFIIVNSFGTFTIYGQVLSPGKYGIEPDQRVSDAVLEAGGFTDIASKNSVKLIRYDEEGEKIVKRIPVAHIFRTGNIKKDVEVEDGDLIIVPESLF
jgi:polysaccharide export outer membrane protein